MDRYVAGFLFHPDGGTVVLIEKTKPAWQQGLLNGVGGKIEYGETPAEAMRREFREETGVDILPWDNYCILTDDATFIVYFFRAYNTRIAQVRTMEEEEVQCIGTDRIPNRVIPNLHWLIPMANSFEQGERAAAFKVTEIYNDI